MKHDLHIPIVIQLFNAMPPSIVSYGAPIPTDGVITGYGYGLSLDVEACFHSKHPSDGFSAIKPHNQIFVGARSIETKNSILLLEKNGLCLSLTGSSDSSCAADGLFDPLLPHLLEFRDRIDSNELT